MSEVRIEIWNQTSTGIFGTGNGGPYEVTMSSPNVDFEPNVVDMGRTISGYLDTKGKDTRFSLEVKQVSGYQFFPSVYHYNVEVPANADYLKIVIQKGIFLVIATAGEGKAGDVGGGCEVEVMIYNNSVAGKKTGSNGTYVISDYNPAFWWGTTGNGTVIPPQKTAKGVIKGIPFHTQLDFEVTQKDGYIFKPTKYKFQYATETTKKTVLFRIEPNKK